uniref:Uncharacterized protein n=1 Tax=uncultured prokaryote TaxID=198431 RepID=H5SKU0_9ZZZZ|nr:hypothetical protein HGMM_F42G09C02 [uncultured prokaryote]
MPFIQFIPGGGNQKIQATLTAKGLLALSADAVKAFGLEGATHVLLFFDPDRRALGLRAARPEDSGALKITQRKRVASLSVRALLEQYRLVVPGKLIMEPQFDEKENLVIIPLLGVRMRPGRRPSTPKPKVVRRPARTAAAAPARRRGRPPKAVANVAEAAPARRGRPRKPEPAAPSPTPKRRGRPPKQAASEAPAATAKRRGRPPKAAATASEKAPKRRGRPRKSESPA